MDGLPPGARGAEGPFFPRPVENGVPQNPIELYWRTPAALDPADTDGAVDLYGTDLTAPPATIFLKSTGDGDVGGADVGGFIARLRHAADDQPAGVGRHDEAGLARPSAGSRTSRSRSARRRGSTAPATPAWDAGT